MEACLVHIHALGLTAKLVLSLLAFMVPLLSLLYYYIIPVCHYGPIAIRQKPVS